MYPQVEFTNQSYVVAVSGGVDSMVLLDVARQHANAIAVAHYQHNVRSKEETMADLAVISSYCKQYSLELIIEEYDGSDSSEAALRKARYEFLESVRSAQDYNVIITAHHFDDYIETAIINLLRGTGSTGLDGMRDTKTIIRPLRKWRKSDILAYARDHSIEWHEDSTNTDHRYLRNYVRGTIIPLMRKNGSYETFEQTIEAHAPVARDLEKELRDINNANLLRYENGIGLSRLWFTLLPHTVAKAVMHNALSVGEFDVELGASQIDKAVIFAKTSRPDTTIDISKSTRLCVEREHIKLLAKD